ncbi:hypothetical protein FA15DRAFT_654062 [Coprinopsis marcescibilis]|uniref:Uncharacterized protein n=1 Tax=Coprinopsis marcescibilis TaxID=230819 RepID=A0A5C3LEI4_COPMA|nr:hypothetical protein FA15DRAFT_654062 [Coprinopsis marcescibilis]
MAYYVNDYAAVGSNRRITPKWSVLLCTDQRVIMKTGMHFTLTTASRAPQSVQTYIGGCGHTYPKTESTTSTGACCNLSKQTWPEAAAERLVMAKAKPHALETARAPMGTSSTIVSSRGPPLTLLLDIPLVTITRCEFNAPLLLNPRQSASSDSDVRRSEAW